MSHDIAADLQRLHEEHPQRAEVARITEHAADVHEDIAHPLLDPDDLRRHAAHDRDLAAKERERLEEF